MTSVMCRSEDRGTDRMPSGIGCMQCLSGRAALRSVQRGSGVGTVPMFPSVSLMGSDASSSLTRVGVYVMNLSRDRIAPHAHVTRRRMACGALRRVATCEAASARRAKRLDSWPSGHELGARPLRGVAHADHLRADACSQGWVRGPPRWGSLRRGIGETRRTVMGNPGESQTADEGLRAIEAPR